ncbi:MAG: hypothetical protein U1D30_22490 [Planctomycetota bacterium]
MVPRQAESYGPVIANLLAEDRLAPLGPGTPNIQARDTLSRLNPEDLFPGTQVRDEPMGRACLSGLWLYHDFLDESHGLSQEIPSATDSYWHGIMHRREPDFGNSKYWFRRVGNHPVFPQLAEAAPDIFESMAGARELDAARDLARGSSWDPFKFIDLCQTSIRVPSDLQLFCRKVQDAEWWLLFDFCFRAAGG